MSLLSPFLRCDGARPPSSLPDGAVVWCCCYCLLIAGYLPMQSRGGPSFSSRCDWWRGGGPGGPLFSPKAARIWEEPTRPVHLSGLSLPPEEDRRRCFGDDVEAAGNGGRGLTEKLLVRCSMCGRLDSGSIREY
jgi:hypothetical protein